MPNSDNKPTTPSKRVVKKKSPLKKAKSSKRGPRSFPAVSLEEALKIAQAIKEHNGGKPWPPEEVANALGIAPKGNKFWYVSSSSRDYGLTIGTRDTEKIELTDLGKEIVYASSSEVEAAGVKKAFLTPDVFNKVFVHYGDGALPELRYLQNTLESEFGVSPEHHDAFHTIFEENKKFLSSFPDIILANNSNKQKDSHAAIVVGQPSSGSSLKLFVAMPFSEKTDRYPEGFYTEVLNSLIIPAGTEAGFEVETARKDGSDIIHATIVNDLLDADLVVADLSDHNPNVLFELGLRMAYDKPIALIRAMGTPPIFDVDHMLRVFEYNPNLWGSTLKHDLPSLINHITGAWDSKDNKNTYMKILRDEKRV